MKVLVVDDERNIRESIRKLFSLEGIEVDTASDGLEGKAALSERSFDAVVLDLRMPGMGGQALLEWIVAEGIRSPVIMISALGEISDAVAALKAGASDYLLKPFDPDELIHKVRSSVQARKREDTLEAGTRTRRPVETLIGSSPAMEALRSLIAKISVSDCTVLITGESGSGKEVVARAIHAGSTAAAEPFVAVNIGGLHSDLAESELFGYEKGAFTGADARKPGLFELAGRGTIFLDEIGEMPLNLQVKLLRVLQDHRIRRLGGTRDLPVDVRVLSATNRDIESAVAEGRFREDLYYRLNVVRIHVPPLRERTEDIQQISNFILAKIGTRMGRPPKELGASALERLCAYRFPGNIRELENILERATIYVEDERIEAADLDLPLDAGSAQTASVQAKSGEAAENPLGSPPSENQPESMIEIEREAILKALKRSGGNRTKAASELGISRRTILNKIGQYGL